MGGGVETERLTFKNRFLKYEVQKRHWACGPQLFLGRHRVAEKFAGPSRITGKEAMEGTMAALKFHRMDGDQWELMTIFLL